MIAYRSFANFTKCICDNISKFPKDIDLIVGIPRSGMLPANLLALYMNKPYTDIESFKEGKIYSCGNRGTFIKENQTKKILVIDDTICRGIQLTKTKEELKIFKDYEFIYAVIYAKTQSKHLVDIYCEIIDSDRIFEWNLFHHKAIIGKSCLDIDGVLCQDPKPEENDDGEKYHKFLISAEPKFIPTVKIKTLITCRLEKYRNETEFWLKKHNVQYDKLIMLNLPNKEARIKWGKYGDYKAEEYKKNEYIFFIESSLKEAIRIKELTKKQVFCIETMCLI